MFFMELDPNLALTTFPHPFPQYYLFTSQRFTSQRFASQRFSVATSTQFYTMTPYYFFSSLFASCWTLKKDNHKGIHTHLCLHLDVHMPCSMKYLLPVQKCTGTNRTRPFSRAESTKTQKLHLLCFMPIFDDVVGFRFLTALSSELPQVRQNGHNGAAEHKTFLSCWEKAPKHKSLFRHILMHGV